MIHRGALSPLMVVLFACSSATTAQLPVEVSFDIDLTAMTSFAHWTRDDEETKVEAKVARHLIEMFRQNFGFWRFIEVGTGQSPVRCRVSLVEKGQHEALLEMECEAWATTSDGHASETCDGLTVTTRLWEPSQFGAGCAKPVEEVRMTLQNALKRFIAADARPRVSRWLQDCVAIASEGVWIDDDVPKVLLPLDLALRCSEFKLHCWSKERFEKLPAWGTGLDYPYPNVRGSIENRRAIEAELKSIRYADSTIEVNGSLVTIDAVEYEPRKDLYLTNVYLTTHVKQCPSPPPELRPELMTLHEVR